MREAALARNPVRLVSGVKKAAVGLRISGEKEALTVASVALLVYDGSRHSHWVAQSSPAWRSVNDAVIRRVGNSPHAIIDISKE